MLSRRKACAICSLAKTKCIWNDQRCERCLRLNKICTPDMNQDLHIVEPQSKRVKRTVQVNTDTETDQDSPSSLLKASQMQLETPETSPSSQTAEKKYDVWLSRFRNQMTQRFPFVPIPVHVTAADLYAEKPVLFNAIMMAACNDPVEQLDRAVSLRKDLAERVIVNGEKSLDILQAILIASAWYHVHLDVNYQITNLLALGTAMLTDLNLNVTPHKEDRRRTVLATEEVPALFYTKAERTLEERRVFLGFQYFCTFVFVLFRRVELVRNEFYGDQCCQMLETANQYSSDRYLIYLYQLAKHAQTFGLVLDLNSDNLLLRKSLSACERDIVRLMKNDFDLFRDSASQINNSATLPARAHTVLVELYYYELLRQLQGNSHTYDHIQHPDEDPTQRCRDIIPNLINMAIEMTAGPPSSWTWLEMWHQTHSVLVLLKTADLENVKYGHDIKNDMSDDLIDNMLRRSETAMREASHRNFTSVSGDHDFYMRMGRQIQTLRERFHAQRSIDLALNLGETL